MKAVKFGVLEVCSVRTCPVSEVVLAASTDCLFSLTVNYYGVSHG
jgi:hypothetical protein